METSMKRVLIPLLLATLPVALARAAEPAGAEPVREPYGIGLEGFPYPYPVSMLPLTNEWQHAHRIRVGETFEANAIRFADRFSARRFRGAGERDRQRCEQQWNQNAFHRCLHCRVRARPARPERSISARPSCQPSRFCYLLNPDMVFGTHRALVI